MNLLSCTMISLLIPLSISLPLSRTASQSVALRHNEGTVAVRHSPLPSRSTAAPTWRKPKFTLRGHRRSVTFICYSPDGKYLATGSADRTAKVWNASTGTLLQTLTGHRGRVTYLCFSPDGKNVVTGSADGVTRVWQLRPLTSNEVTFHYCVTCGTKLRSGTRYCTHCGRKQ